MPIRPSDLVGKLPEHIGFIIDTLLRTRWKLAPGKRISIASDELQCHEQYSVNSVLYTYRELGWIVEYDTRMSAFYFSVSDE